MAKIVVRLPEPRKVYTEDNQRQINRAISSVIEQLNSTYMQPDKDDLERIDILADRLQRSRSDAIRFVIRNYVEGIIKRENQLKKLDLTEDNNLNSV